MNTNPILIVGADEEDFELLSRAFTLESVPNNLIWLRDGHEALSYLAANSTKPFIILTEVYMPGMTGLEFRRIIEADPVLKSKSIPFIFLSEVLAPKQVKDVYAMSVQGLFDKQNSLEHLRRMVKVIYDYWQFCRHPDEFN